MVIGDGLHDVFGQFVGVQRVGLVPDLGQVALGELVGVGDDQAAARQVVDVGLQRGRVHRDQHVGTVTRGEDVVVGDLDLERRHTGQRALRCADLGGVIRLGGKVVAEERGLRGEPVTGQLHAVTGVTREADDDLLELLPRGCAALGAGAVVTAVMTHDPAFHAVFSSPPSAIGARVLAAPATTV